MAKVRNFAELAPNIGFSEFDFYDLYRSIMVTFFVGYLENHRQNGIFEKRFIL